MVIITYQKVCNLLLKAYMFLLNRTSNILCMEAAKADGFYLIDPELSIILKSNYMNGGHYKIDKSTVCQGYCRGDRGRRRSTLHLHQQSSSTGKQEACVTFSNQMFTNLFPHISSETFPSIQYKQNRLNITSDDQKEQTRQH